MIGTIKRKSTDGKKRKWFAELIKQNNDQYQNIYCSEQKRNPIKKRIVNNLCFNFNWPGFVVCCDFSFKYSYQDNKSSNKFLNYIIELFR